MKPILAKIDINDIKHMVCEVVNQLNELSSKDWHDKYLTNIPEDVFYVVMGRDKKKTPIKELMFAVYMNELNNGEAQDSCQTKLLNIANDYNTLNDVGTQEVNALLNKYGADSFDDFSHIINFVKKKYNNTNDDFGGKITMYAKNCVRLFENDKWLVLCPLTADASRECIADNGNHWCTCSSSYMEHFPEYTYEEDSCIIAFLCKEGVANSFQVQINKEGILVVACDYYDNTMMKTDSPFPFRNFDRFIGSLTKRGIIAKLVSETKSRSLYIRVDISDNQLLKFVMNTLKKINKDDPGYWKICSDYVDIDNGIYLYRPKYLEGEKEWFLCKFEYYKGNMYVTDSIWYSFFYHPKTGTQLISKGDDSFIEFAYLNSNYNVYEICSSYNHIPLGYVDNAEATIVFFDKRTNKLSFLPSYTRSVVEVSFAMTMPIISSDSEERPYMDFDGNIITDDVNYFFNKKIILPEFLGGGETNIEIGLNPMGAVKSGDFYIRHLGNGIITVSNEADGLDSAIYGYGPECMAVYHNCTLFKIAGGGGRCFLRLNTKRPISINEMLYGLDIRINVSQHDKVTIVALGVGEHHRNGIYTLSHDSLKNFLRYDLIPNADRFDREIFDSKYDSLTRFANELIRNL